jgi:TolB-like protein
MLNIFLLLVQLRLKFDNEINKPQMSSVIEGYNYDIFISYRQKDNKHDGWVTEFVNNLKGELESTFKEEISVYFDINPHDGLLETHDVDASLKDKLRCLVFLPIISRTYCDPKSFAWEHEFKSFVGQASKDQFGLKVKLPNGNIANRIIPVQIHDLHPEDKTIIERELGGILRAIEFIYKEPGVNKPLSTKDNEEKNSNKTNYRIQINKIANAIDEIISSLKGTQITPADKKLFHEHPDHKTVEVNISEKRGADIINQKSKKWLITLFSAVIFIIGAIAVLKIVERNEQSDDIVKLEKSIAVLPFVNDSPDKENEYFCNGMMDEILNNLQKIKDLRVLSRTSVEQYRGSAKPSIPRIAKTLDVNYIVEGSVQKYGNTFRLRVQLIAANYEKHLWGESYQQEINEVKDIFNIQSQIAQKISAQLKAIITPEEKRLIEHTPSNNITAYELYLQARNEHLKFSMDHRNINALDNAISFYRRAIQNDASYAQAYSGLALVFADKYDYQNSTAISYPDSMIICADKALSYNAKLDEAHLVKGMYYDIIGVWEKSLEEYNESIRINPNYSIAYLYRGRLSLMKIHDVYGGLSDNFKAIQLELGPQLPMIMRETGTFLGDLGFPDKGRYFIEEALKLDHDSVKYYNSLAYTEFYQNNFALSLNVAQKTLKHDPKNLLALFYCMRCYGILGKYEEANQSALKWLKEIEKLRISSKSGWEYIGISFWQTGHINEAKYYLNKQIDLYKQILTLDPNDPNIRTWLAGVYSFMGQTNKAIQTFNLEEMLSGIKDLNETRIASEVFYNILKYDPLYENMRTDSKFQQFLKSYENTYYTGHERLKKWLTEHGML